MLPHSLRTTKKRVVTRKMDPPTMNAMDASAAASDSSCCDHRLLEASSKGQTDAVLQLLEENGQHLHAFKDKVRLCTMVI